MDNNKIGFVILNYNTYEDVKECISSIVEKIDNNNYEIVIVDNKSTDNSVNDIRQTYQNEKVHLIVNEDNLGFSKGNNVGIKYAVNVLKCGFVVMLNADTFLIQKDFFSKILNEFKKSNCAIIGPEINNYNNEYQFPKESITTIQEVKNRIVKLRIHYILNLLFIDKIYKLILSKIKKDNSKQFKNIRKENVIVHGSCIIFTPSFFCDGRDCIPEVTKFYCEEEVIFFYSFKNNLKIVYNPEIKIFHKKSSSINKKYKSYREINKFKYKSLIDANQLLLNYMKEL